MGRSWTVLEAIFDLWCKRIARGDDDYKFIRLRWCAKVTLCFSCMSIVYVYMHILKAHCTHARYSVPFPQIRGMSNRNMIQVMNRLFDAFYLHSIQFGFIFHPKQKKQMHSIMTMGMGHGQLNAEGIQSTKIWDSCVVSHDQIICERDGMMDGICTIWMYIVYV